MLIISNQPRAITPCIVLHSLQLLLLIIQKINKLLNLTKLDINFSELFKNGFVIV